MNPSYIAIVTLLSLAITAISKAQEIKRIASRNKELTPEQDRELDEKIDNLQQQAHWQIEDNPGTPVQEEGTKPWDQGTQTR